MPGSVPQGWGNSCRRRGITVACIRLPISLMRCLLEASAHFAKTLSAACLSLKMHSIIPWRGSSTDGRSEEEGVQDPRASHVFGSRVGVGEAVWRQGSDAATIRTAIPENVASTMWSQAWEVKDGDVLV